MKKVNIKKMINDKNHNHNTKIMEIQKCTKIPNVPINILKYT